MRFRRRTADARECLVELDGVLAQVLLEAMQPETKRPSRRESVERKGERP